MWAQLAVWKELAKQVGADGHACPTPRDSGRHLLAAVAKAASGCEPGQKDCEYLESLGEAADHANRGSRGYRGQGWDSAPLVLQCG